MRTAISATPMARAVIARALGGHAQLEVAAKRWGAASSVVALIRAGVGDIAATDLGARTGQDEFFANVIDASPFGAGNWRRVGFHKRLLAATSKLTGTWVAQSKAIHVSRPNLTPATLEPRKVAALTISTAEAFEDPLAEPLIDAELQAAAVGGIVTALLDAGNAGDEATPAALTHSSNATQISATDEPADDVAAVVAAFGGNLREAICLTDPLTGAQLGLSRDAAGNFQFPRCGARGGEIVGIPVYTFADAPRDTNGGTLLLCDPTGIAVAIDSLRIERARQATLECDTAPQGASDTPVASSATMISLFQANLIAHLIVIAANWSAQRPGSCVALVGTDYATSVS